MSEQNSSGFPFAELPGGEGLDIDAIFGGAPSGAASSDMNPFEAALAQQTAPAQPIVQPVAPQSVSEQFASQQIVPPVQQPAAPMFQTVQSIQPPAVQQVPAATPAVQVPAPAATQPQPDVRERFATCESRLPLQQRQPQGISIRHGSQQEGADELL